MQDLFKNSINEKSHSKDLISLQNGKHGRYILKVWESHNIGEKSVQKQIDFRNLLIGNCIIKTPKVFHTESLIDGRFLAKMDFIEGDCGIDIVGRMSRRIVSNLKEVLGYIIDINLGGSTLTEISAETFKDKLRSIQLNTKSKEFLNILFHLEQQVINWKSIPIPIGNCHGDLTLSNLIISGTENINLIDFLPSFIETPLWDVVKLEQDLIMGWSYRYLNDSKKINAKIFYDECLPKHLELISKKWPYQTHLLSVINLCRIIPYIKDKVTEDWLIINLKRKLNNLI